MRMVEKEQTTHAALSFVAIPLVFMTRKIGWPYGLMCGDYRCRMPVGNERDYVAFAVGKSIFGGQHHTVKGITKRARPKRSGKTMASMHQWQITLAVPSTPLIGRSAAVPLMAGMSRKQNCVSWSRGGT